MRGIIGSAIETFLLVLIALLAFCIAVAGLSDEVQW